MSRADEIAKELLAQCQQLSPPVDIAAVAAAIGVSVIDSTMPNDVSGMLVRDGEHATVGLNNGQSKVRRRFTLAHELGHFRLHRGRPLIVDSSIRVNMRDSRSAAATDREEIEANRFAAALLMPETWVSEAVSASSATSIDSLRDSLAREFEVSADAMGYRLLNLGLTS